MRIFYDNLIDYASVVISAATVDNAFPASNVAHQHKAKVYRTGTSQAAEYVKFDLGSAKSVTSIIILAHTLTAGDTLLKCEASTDDFSSTAFTQNLTYAANLIAQNFSSQSYRYWRFSFTKSAAGQTRDIGRIFLGTYYQTTEAPDYDGLDLEREDLSTIQRSVGGQVYADIRSQYRAPILDFSAVSKTQKETFETIAARVGKHTSFFAQIDENAGSGVESEFLYVNFRKLPKFSVSGFDNELKWDTRLELEEQL
jgi:hypothetical protein